MFNATNPYPTIQQWEEAGVSLLSALEKYSKVCTTLGEEYRVDGLPPTFLATRIEHALDSLHTTIGSQLAQAQSILAQTRNLAVAPLHRFPEEVLSGIFTHVVFASLDQFFGSDTSSIKMGVIGTYRALHTLLGVCTLWRNVAINRGTLWSIIPLFEKIKIPQGHPLHRVLHESKGLALNLIANMCSNKTDISLLSTHVAQFRTVSIAHTPLSMVRTILAVFTDWCGPDPLCLTRLSLHHHEPCGGAPVGDYIYQSVLEQQPFNRLAKNLTLLQMSKTLVHWETVSFSDRLTSFHLRDVKLGFDSNLSTLLGAISSATQLRELKLVNIETCQDSSPLPSLVERSRTWLPALESLYLGNLYFNTLRLLLLSIRSRSHRLTLGFSAKLLQIHHLRPLGIEDVQFNEVSELLRPISVDTVWIDSCTLEPSFSAADLKGLLGVLSPLVTLRLTTTLLGTDHCMALERPPGVHQSTTPSFVNLQLFYFRLGDIEALKRMVYSHSGPLQRLVLANLVRRYMNTTHEESMEEKELENWLRERIPEYIRRNDDDHYFDCQLFLRDE